MKLVTLLHCAPQRYTKEADAMLLTSDDEQTGGYAGGCARPSSDCTVNIFNESGEKLVISQV